VDYVYAEGQLLVREEYLSQVYEVLNPGYSVDFDQVTRLVPGVSLITQIPNHGPRVFGTLQTIDRILGAGAATPNHVLTVAPGGPCPATEPEQVYFGTEPYPPVNLANGGSGVLIYIADTGLLEEATTAAYLSDHPWLAGVQRALKHDGTVQDWDPVRRDGTAAIPPYAGHGTFAAGVARCMAPEADVIVSNVFKTAGSALESDFVLDLKLALELGVDIFNLSITAPTRTELPLLGFDGWLRRLSQHKGVICVVAAGNDGRRKPTWPAAYPGMLSVGALGRDWHGRAQFSNYGGWVDVYAPGRDLVNAFTTGTYICDDPPYTGQKREFYGMARWSGTSFSTPLVSGLIAARMSRTGEDGQRAARALLTEAQAQAIPGVGAVLLPHPGQ
jgi:subtilisin family serine protease